MSILEKLKTRKVQRIVFIVGMLSLPLLQWLVFFVFVNINTIRMSFQDMRPNAPEGFSLVNYRNFFMDLRATDKFLYALRNSLLFGLNDLFLLFVSLVLAYFFYKKIRWSSFFRIIFFLPSIISIVIFITAYQNMFNMGVVDSILKVFGAKELPDWFANTSPWLVPLIMLYCLWVGTGYNVLIMGGAMGNLPEDVMEYSRLEGVNYFNEFFRVVIPMIWPTVMVGVLGSITVMFTLFLQVDLMTVNGGTKGQAMTISYMINGYVKSRDLGRASTYGVIFTIVAMPIIITKLLLDGKNEIKAVFSSIDKYIKAKNAENELTSGSEVTLLGFSHVRKANYMMGWDWGPRLPDVGIWKDIYLIDGTLPRITDVRILQHHEDGKVALTVKAETSLPAEVKVTITAPNGATMYAMNGETIEIDNPQLWWPNGYGEQALYTVKTESIVDGKTVDTNEKKVGLRTLYISRELDEWGEEFCYKVNGVKIFGMGADYIPEDNILGRLSREKTKKLLEDCIFANFNSVRVWGGGFYPHDYFFELCDELGIIVFMDMMFACSSYPWHEEFLESVKVELTQNLRRIRHHACLGIISGNNEIEEEAGVEGWWRKEEQAAYLLLFEDIIPKIVAAECPEISFVPSSPSARGGFVNPTDENVGDSHYWQVWHGNLPFTEYRKHYFRFLSEFGFQSFPTIKTLEEITLPEDRNPFSAVMELHQRNPAANGKILNYLSQTYLYPTDFNTLVYASQLLQAEAIKYGVEHLRRNRGRCMGALYWQLNDCWPVASWSSVDSNGRYKALHYEAKRFYEPVHISCVETGEYTKRKDITMERAYGYETKAQIFVNNDTLQDVEGVVEWQLCDSLGNVLQSGSEQLCVKALSYASLAEMDFHKTATRDNYLAFAYKVNGVVVSSGTVLFTKPKHFHFVDPKISLTVGDGYIDVTAEAFAKYIYIRNDNDDLVLSDNFFDMGKGTKRLKIISGETTNLQVKTVFDIK